jgi:hypothetical protein
VGLHVEAQADRVRGCVLTLRYRLTGPLAEVRMPPAARPSRADGLWRRTCFEAFVAGPAGGYFEFNLSPSGQWAAYRFSGYRAGMEEAVNVGLQNPEAQAFPDHFELSAAFDLAETALADEPVWRLGLSAVIEDTAGGLSYWAIAHPPGRPDFHNPSAFAAQLPEPV